MHSAFIPQDPGQGLIHLLFKHALSKAQSELMTHSGLHDGLFAAFGPRQTSQIANWFPYVSHEASGSQGFGVQGCEVELSDGIIIAEIKIKIVKITSVIRYQIFLTQ